MKRLLISIITLSFLTILLISCSNEAIINQTIDAFQNAVNKGDIEGIKATLSPYCDWDITGVQDKIYEYHLKDHIPLSYTDRSISVNSPWADVEAVGNYQASLPLPAWFRMRKNDGFFSFLNPEWKIKEFYDQGDHSTVIWKKIQEMSAQ
jgi:hypothetical protein